MPSPIALVLAGLLCVEATGADLEKLGEEVRQLRAEIRELKRSVEEMQQERQGTVVAGLEADLQQVTESLAKLDAEDAERLESVREIEEHLNSPSLTDEQRAQTQAIHAALIGPRLSALNRQRQVLFEREALLRKRIGAERQRLENRLPVRR